MKNRITNTNFNTFKMKLLSFNHLKDPFLPSISMADANLQENDLLYLLRLMFFADRKWNNYIESIARFAARKVGSHYFT